MSKKVYVGNIPFAFEDRDLDSLFSEVGNVVSAQVIRDRESGRSKGFAFVEFKTDEEAQKAITEIHDTLVNGRKVVVSEARERSFTKK